MVFHRCAHSHLPCCVRAIRWIITSVGHGAAARPTFPHPHPVPHPYSHLLHNGDDDDNDDDEFRRKIPKRYHSQRNCQLVMIVVSVIVTLGMSFAPFVDWAAHFGGAIQVS